jgi:hypothetical protein
MSQSSTNNAAIVRYGRWRNQFMIAPVAVTLAAFFWYNDVERSLGFWIAMVFFGALTVFSVLPSDTIFDPDRRDIERRWSLFGIVPVFRRRLSLGQFRQICWRCVAGVQPHDWHTWMVGFERVSGRPVYVSYFSVTHDGVCGEARLFAIELSKLTGLPLSDEIRAG